MLARYSSAAFTNGSGVSVAAGAAVTVRVSSTSALASIFEDRDGLTGITQPGFVADSEGRFSFCVAALAEGFDITVDDGVNSHTLENVGIGLAQEFDIDEFWRTVLGTATKALARLGLGIGAATDTKTLVGDGTDFIPVPVPMGFSLLNGYLDWTVAGNVLTVAVKNWAGTDPSAADPVYIAFRDPTAATGLPLIRKLIGATSVTASSGSTLGTVANTAFRLWCVAFDDGGTVRLGLINCLSGTAPSLNIYPLAGWGIASSTAEGGAGAADLAATFYTGAVVTSKAYAVLGYATWETGLATAGTWSAGPTRKQLFGVGVPLPGQEIQSSVKRVTAASSTATAIPYDNSIPQSGEGAEFMAADAFTPRSAANVLDIDALALHRGSAGQASTGALFQDAIAGALAALSNVTSSSDGTLVAVDHRMRAGTTSATTFKYRAGPSTGTLYFNADSAGNPVMGGVAASRIRVKELMA